MSTSMLPGEGSVSVRLWLDGDRDGMTIRRAEVAARRPRAVAALAGRKAEEAARLAPLLFSLCGNAQGLAVARACEAALRLDSGAHDVARSLLTDAEALDSLGWQAVVEWPARLGAPPRPAALRELRSAVSAVLPALYPTKDGLRPGGGMLRPDIAALRNALDRMAGWLEATVFAGPPPRDVDELAGWAARGGTDAALLAARLLSPDLAGWGACGVPLLGERSPGWFAAALAGDPAFATAPRRNGAPALTGPLERQAEHPLVVSVTERFGDGLARLFAARLADLAELPRRMEAAIAALRPADPVAAAPANSAPGEGCGVAETARGRLAHWLRLDGDGRLADARMVAPTDWNFAADGPLARGLAGAAVRDRDDAVERARLLVAMLDPCIACGIDVHE